MGRIHFPSREFHAFSFSILFSCAFFIAQSQAQQPELAVIKGNPDDQLGRAIATADVDGDGYLDFIVGAPLAKVDKAEQGYVAIYSGDDFEEIGKRIGSSKGSMAGFAIANAGDLDGDGTDEIIWGAPGDSKNGEQSGMFEVYSVEQEKVLYSISGKPGDRLGYAVVGLGDVNGDGASDFAVSAPGGDTEVKNVGYVVVVSGKDGEFISAITGHGKDDQIGSSLAAVRDMDGDGIDELIVGSGDVDGNKNNTGKIACHNPSNGLVILEKYGEEKGDHFGSTIAAGGDLNGDNVNDFLVGAPGVGKDKGAIFAISGEDGSILYSLKGNHSGDHFGISVAYAGDLDKDGISDFVVGAHAAGDGSKSDNEDDNKGKVYIFSGKDGTKLVGLKGDKPFDHFGYSVAVVGLAQSDGAEIEYPDIVVGVPKFGAEKKGAIRIFSTNPCSGKAFHIANKSTDYLGSLNVKGCLAKGEKVTFEVFGPPNDTAWVHFPKTKTKQAGIKKKGVTLTASNGETCTWHLKNKLSPAVVKLDLNEDGYASIEVDLSEIKITKPQKTGAQAVFGRKLGKNAKQTAYELSGCTDAYKMIIGPKLDY